MATKNSTTTLTTQQVKKGLEKSTTVASEEEKALRMRNGVSVELKAPLARKAAAGSEVADELLLMEMQLLKAYRQHLAAKKGQEKAKVIARPRAAAATAKAPANRTKDKIVRALRKKR